jgi:hypothetical protein
MWYGMKEEERWKRKMKKKDEKNEKNEEAENGYLLGAAGEIST